MYIYMLDIQTFIIILCVYIYIYRRGSIPRVASEFSTSSIQVGIFGSDWGSESWRVMAQTHESQWHTINRTKRKRTNANCWYGIDTAWASLANMMILIRLIWWADEYWWIWFWNVLNTQNETRMWEFTASEWRIMTNLRAFSALSG